MAVAFAAWTRLRRGPPSTASISWRWFALAAAILLLYAVLRNIPVYPFELLAPH
jgi:hypothetical protein